MGEYMGKSEDGENMSDKVLGKMAAKKKGGKGSKKIPKKGSQKDDGSSKKYEKKENNTDEGNMDLEKIRGIWEARGDWGELRGSMKSEDGENMSDKVLGKMAAKKK